MTPKTRFFLTHLTLSLIVIFIMAIMVFFVWYPYPLAKALGVIDIFTLVVIIDLILGPILGWFVYKEGKKTLLVDISFIILIQFIAFLYGFYSLSQGRPLWLVYSQVHFDVIQKTQIDSKTLKLLNNKYSKIPFWGPKYAALKLEGQQYSINTYNSNYINKGWTSYPGNYTDISKVSSRLSMYAFDLKYLSNNNDEKKVNLILNQYPKANAWLPLKAQKVDMVVLVNTNRAEVVQIVDLRPL